MVLVESRDTSRLDTPPFHLRLPVSLDSVTAVLDALEAYAETAELAPGIAARLALIAEEVAANVVKRRGVEHFAIGPRQRQAPERDHADAGERQRREHGGDGRAQDRRRHRRHDWHRG